MLSDVVQKYYIMQFFSVAAMVHHKRIMTSLFAWKPELPVFRASDGSLFTTKLFNDLLRFTMGGEIDFERHVLSAHSFRAGLPSQLQALNSKAVNMQSWGRWRSNAAERYRRLGFSENRAQFKNIVKNLSL